MGRTSSEKSDPVSATSSAHGELTQCAGRGPGTHPPASPPALTRPPETGQHYSRPVPTSWWRCQPHPAPHAPPARRMLTPLPTISSLLPGLLMWKLGSYSYFAHWLLLQERPLETLLVFCKREAHERVALRFGPCISLKDTPHWRYA